MNQPDAECQALKRRIKQFEIQIKLYKRMEEQFRLNESRLESLFKLSQIGHLTEKEAIDFALEEAVRLTGSKIGYLHLVAGDQETLELQTWSKQTISDCNDPGGMHARVPEAGIWADAVRQRKPVIHNNYENYLKKKGYPDSHIPIKRHLSIPVIDGDRTVIVAGVANKDKPYDVSDARQLQLFMFRVWSIISKKRAENVLRQSEEYYRDMIEDANDIILTIDFMGKIKFLNKAVKYITGYSNEEIPDIFFWLTADSLAKVRDNMSRKLAGEKMATHYDVDLIAKDGRIVNVDISSRIVYKDGVPFEIQATVRDDTERNRLERSLRESEVRYRDLIENATDMIITSDMEGRITSLNKAITTVTGYCLGDFTHIFGFFNTDHQQQVRESLRKKVSGEVNTTAYESEFLTKDGKIINVDISTRIVYKEGKPLETQAIIRDITGRKRLERSLQKSENLYKTIANSLPLTDIYLYDKNLRFLVATSLELNRFNENTGTLVDKPLSDIFDNETFEKLAPVFIEALNGTKARSEITYRSNHYQIHTIPFIDDEADGPTAIAVMHNITDIKKTGEELRKMFLAVEYSANAIIIFNKNNIIEYINPKFLSVSGLDPAELSGRDINDLQKFWETSDSFDSIGACLRSGKDWKGEARGIKKDGQVYWESITISPILDEKFHISHFVAIMEDITGRKLSEDKILRFNRNLQMLNKCYEVLIRSDNENEMLNAFCDLITSIINYPFASIVIKGLPDGDDPGKCELKLKYYSGRNVDGLDMSIESLGYLYDDCVISQSIEQSEIRICDNLNECRHTFNLMKKNEYRSLISLPVHGQNNDKGALIIFSADKTAFDDYEISLLSDLVNYIDFGLGVINDKKERRRFQEIQSIEKEQLGTTLKNIGDGIIAINKEGYITIVNDAALKILEKDFNQLIGRQVIKALNIVDDDDKTIDFNPFDVVKMPESQSQKLNRVTLVTAAGVRKFVNITSNAVIDKISNLIGIVIVIRDITERIGIENHIALSQKMEAVGQLAAGIAHEINTPMQFVGDNTFFMKDAFDSLINYMDAIDKMMEGIKGLPGCESAGDAMAAIKQNLDIEYLTGEIPIALARTQNGIERVRNLVLAMKNFAHPSGNQKALANINKGIEVTVAISKNEWKYVSDLGTVLDESLPLVNCCLDEINQVILNMIINAAHAIGEIVDKNSDEKGKITIVTRTSGDFAEIVISDTGCGIPKEKISRIYEPFFTTKVVGKGTGQGLAIAHDIIVNKHNGEIKVDSAIGKGTAFTIKIPVN